MRGMLAVALVTQLCTFNLAHTAYAQGDTPDSLRSKHVQSFPNHFFLGPVIKRKEYYFKLSGNDPSLSYRYNPSSRASIGVAANMFNVGFELLVGTRQSDESKSRYGETKSFDMQSVALGEKWLHDIYYQRYESFYVTYPGQKVPAGAPFPQRPDVLTRNFGYTATYFFSPKFSLRAAYSATERQLHSQGSFILSTGFTSTLMAGSDSIIPDSAWSSLGQGADALELQFSSLGIAPGYTYSLVSHKYFFNAFAVYGPAHYWTRYITESSGEHYDISINAIYYFRASIGYNGDRFFAAFNYVQQGRIVKFEDMSSESASTMFRVVLGFRFVEKGFLKKDAWDYAPKVPLHH